MRTEKNRETKKKKKGYLSTDRLLLQEREIFLFAGDGSRDYDCIGERSAEK